MGGPRILLAAVAAGTISLTAGMPRLACSDGGSAETEVQRTCRIYGYDSTDCAQAKRTQCWQLHPWDPQNPYPC